MRKITKVDIEKMVELFDSGLSQAEIGKQLGICSDTVRKYLRKENCNYSSYFDRLTETEKMEVVDLYLENKWDIIFFKHPFLNKNRVYHIVSSLGVRKITWFWSEEDIQLLKNNYGNLDSNTISNMMDKRHSPKAITAKAIKWV